MDPAVRLRRRRPFCHLEDRRVRFERAVEVRYEERPLRPVRKSKSGPYGVDFHAGRRVCVPDLKVFSHNELAKPGVLINVVGRSRTI